MSFKSEFRYVRHLQRTNRMLQRELKEARRRLDAMPALRRELAETRQKLLVTEAKLNDARLAYSYKQPGHR
jgi:hypothetical protein